MICTFLYIYIINVIIHYSHLTSLFLSIDILGKFHFISCRFLYMLPFKMQEEFHRREICDERVDGEKMNSHGRLLNRHWMKQVKTITISCLSHMGGESTLSPHLYRFLKLDLLYRQFEWKNVATRFSCSLILLIASCHHSWKAGILRTLAYSIQTYFLDSQKTGRLSLKGMHGYGINLREQA